MKLYEGMVLLENNFARENWEKASKLVTDLLEKNGAKIVKAEKWDERKLAYEIKNQKRATFLLVHFEAPQHAITTIEKDLGLQEEVLRSMILVDTDGVEAPEASEATNVVASY